MLRIALISCFVALAVSKKPFEPTTNYCEIGTCRRGPHIGCGNDGKFGNNCTINAKVIRMKRGLKKQILTKLNGWRSQIARGGFNGLSPAVRMATMRWEDELAYLAELNVRQCLMHQDACRNTKRYKMAGQTIAYMGYTGHIPSTEEIILEQLRLWFNEYVDITMDEIVSYQLGEVNKTTTNFAQMMQDKSDAVGCAVVTQMYNDWVQYFLACNYAVITVMGASVYESGLAAASDCKTGGNPDYPSLCSTSEQYKGGASPPMASDEEAEETDADDTDKGTVFDNLMEKIARHSTRAKKLNITVQTFGHQQVNRDRISFDNRKRSTKSKQKKMTKNS